MPRTSFNQQTTGSEPTEASISTLVENGSLSAALERLEASLEQGATSELWNDWSTVVCAYGDHLRAEKGYRRALRLDPLHRAAALNLTLLLLLQRRLEDAGHVLKPFVDSLDQEEHRVFGQLTAEGQRLMAHRHTDCRNSGEASAADAIVNQDKRHNDLVIARYKENLEWITSVPDDFDVIIYNKGEAVTSPTVTSRASVIVEKPNFGRESETYLEHMIRLRRSVASPERYTVFTQGDPFEHSPDFIELLKRWHSWAPVQALSWGWRGTKDIPPAEILSLNQARYTGGIRVRPELYSLITWNPIDFCDAGAYDIGIRYRRLHNLPEGTNLASHFLHRCGLETLADSADEYSVGCFSYGAIFAARNHTVFALSLNDLKRLHSVSTRNEVYGYIFERMWLHLLGTSFLMPHASRYDKQLFGLDRKWRPFSAPSCDVQSPDRTIAETLLPERHRDNSRDWSMPSHRSNR